MISVIKKTPELKIKETYRLCGNDNICKPVEDLMIDEDGKQITIVILEHDQKQMTAAEMNELILIGAKCFDTPEKFEKWKNKNGQIEEISL